MPWHGWVPSQATLVPMGAFSLPWCCGPGPPHSGARDHIWLAGSWTPGWLLNSPSTGRGSHCKLQCLAQPHESGSLETSSPSPSLSWAINCQQKVMTSTWTKAPTTHPHLLGFLHADPTPVSPVLHHQRPAHPRGIMATTSLLTHSTSPSTTAQPSWHRHCLHPSPTMRPWGQPGALPPQWDPGMPARLQQGWVPGRWGGQDRAHWLLCSCRCGPPSSFTSPSPSLSTHQHQCPEPGPAAGHSTSAPCPQPWHCRGQNRGEMPFFQGPDPTGNPMCWALHRQWRSMDAAKPHAGPPAHQPSSPQCSPCIQQVPSTPASRARCCRRAPGISTTQPAAARPRAAPG